MTEESNDTLVLDDLQEILKNFSIYYDELNISGNSSSDGFLLDPGTFACEPFNVSLALSILVCTFYLLVFFLAIPGNFVAAVAIGSSHRALSPSELYLRHLAIADGLLALTLPLWAVAALRGWTFGDSPCKLASLVLEGSFYSSMLLLACISVERYRLVVRAAQSRNEARRRRGSWLACAAVWALGGALSLPALLKGQVRPVGSVWPVCEENYSPEAAAAWRLATRLLRHTLGFLLPLAIMLTCCWSTAERLRRTRGRRGQRARRLISAVIPAFLLCWAPHHLAVMADTLQRTGLVPGGCEARRAVGATIFSTQMLGVLHSAINPVLYAFISHDFRRRMCQRLCGQRAADREVLPRGSRSLSQNSDGVSTAL
ncbi:C-X-C chemokine receptor type 1-like [Brienomyrus brachyistius]|uniref:C-X-C chemokine receptor type 1-like n=1 Tax=Brienomyrus brachyistius TaxID=42636 RepID=UPI0020B427F4|nr:C-X-C chemokine receptor type 1-like [Brienomyrus brachyistius]